MDRLSVLLILFWGQLLFSQEITKVEFHYFNSMIAGSEINIVFEPIENKRVKITTKKKNGSFNKKITQNKFLKLCKAISEIDTIKNNYNLVKGKDSIKYTCLDGSDIFITSFQKKSKKQYFVECLSPRDRSSLERKEFWNVVHLLTEIVGIRIEDLY